MTFGPNNTLGPFLPINEYYTGEEEEFRVQLTNRDRDIARYLNIREIAIYDLVEYVNGEQWFNTPNPQQKRDGFRKVFELGALGAGATLTSAHGITGFTVLTFTHIYGTLITSAGSFPKRPLPYVSATLVTDQVQVDCDDTNFRIINGATAPNIVSGILVLEYIKI